MDQPPTPQGGARGVFLPPRTTVIPMLYLFAAVRGFSPFAYMIDEDMYVAVGGIMLLTFLVAAVFWCLWVHRATLNAIAARDEHFEFTPGWAVGVHFLPIFNLIRPFNLVKLIHERSNAQVTALFTAWWGFWVAGNVLGQINARLESDDSIGFDALVAALMVVASVLAAQVVRTVNQAQIEYFKQAGT